MEIHLLNILFLPATTISQKGPASPGQEFASSRSYLSYTPPRPALDRVLNTNEKPCTCTVYGKGSSLFPDLRKNSYTHTDKFRSLSKLRHHSSTHSEKPLTCIDNSYHKCSVCVQGFVSAMNLEGHISAHHTCAKPEKWDSVSFHI